MKINKLKKMTNGKYKLYLDNGEVITTYDDIILKNNLLYRKEIDSQLLNELLLDNNYYDLYNKCVNLISKRIRSEKEIREYLNKYTENNDDINSIIHELKNIGLINDLSFIKAYIYDKLNLSNIGPLKIEKELLEHNIDENIIREELSKIDDNLIYSKVDKYINKKIANNTKYSSYILKQKITNDLYNNGYSIDLINSILDTYKINSNIDKELLKQYKNLKKKYNGEELIYKLKNKLYQKGYSKEEIEESIKKVDL